jgi:hypothetical protein
MRAELRRQKLQIFADSQITFLNFITESSQTYENRMLMLCSLLTLLFIVYKKLRGPSEDDDVCACSVTPSLHPITITHSSYDALTP